MVQLTIDNDDFDDDDDVKKDEPTLNDSMFKGVINIYCDKHSGLNLFPKYILSFLCGFKIHLTSLYKNLSFYL